MEPEKGLDAFERLLSGRPAGQIVVAPILWPVLRGQIAAGAEPPFLQALLGAAAPVEAERARPPLVAQLEAAAPRERLGLLVGFIRQRTLKVLALDPDFPLDTRKPLSEMGLDSLMAVELKNALDAGVGRKLPATLVFEHPTIDALAQHLLDNVLGLAEPVATQPSEADNKAEAAKAPAGPPTALTEEAVSEMSDEEAEAALLQKLLELDE